MKILVTGANGQLGTEIRNLQAVFPQVEFTFTDITDGPTAGAPSNWARLDITDEAAVKTMVGEWKPDVLINCAAFTAVDKAESNADLCRRLNTDAPAILARAMNSVGGEIIQISTDYVFGGDGHIPYTEDMPTGPQSVYGLTKLDGEIAVREACPHSIIIRTAWLYSPYGNNYVRTMLRLGKERDTLNVVFDQVGTPTYALDLARAALTIALSKDKVYGTFHFTDEGVISWYDFTQTIFRLEDIKSCAVYPIHTREYPTPAHRPAYSVLDKTKIKETYHLHIPYWVDSLEDCLKRLKD